MIDLEKAKVEFLEYVKKFDVNDSNIERKTNHSIRVKEISRKIAEKIQLQEEKIKLAELIGLLHDIGRFEQYTKYKTFNDLESIDHGDYCINILKENDYIRKYIYTDKYDNIIFKAIKNHNKFQIEKGLTPEEIIYAKLIRDADKLDIFYEVATMFWKENKEEIESGIICKDIEEQIKNRKVIKREKGRKYSRIDKVISTIAFIFDLNYTESFKILKEYNYINNGLNQFQFKNIETKNKIEQIKDITNKYIDEKIKQ